MTTQCSRYEADWELAVLGVLDDAAMREMQQHLESGCDGCRTRFQEAQLLLSAVAELAPEATISPAVEGRLAARLKGRPKQRWTLAPWVAVAASLALAAWLGYDRGRLVNELAVAQLQTVRVSVPGPAAPVIDAPVRGTAPVPVSPAAPAPDLTARLAELQQNLDTVRASAKTEAEKSAQLQRELAAVNERLHGMEQELKTAQARPPVVERPADDRQSVALRQELARKEAEVQRYARQLTDLRGVLRVLQSPSLKQVEMTPSDAGVGRASARALVAPDGGLLILARQLPVLPNSKCYQLWILRKTGPAIVSGGLLATDGSGGGILYAAPSESLTVATGFAITDEPAGGSVSAKGHKLLFGAI
ncbi:MAG: anti-sigma factor [Bryobacteraceae bacterium]